MRLALLILVALAAPAAARTATGYQGGQQVKLKIVDVGGAEAEVHTAKAYRAMAKAAHKAGISLSIRSGYRTHAKQKKLYKQYRHGEGNLAARPGFSQHENGRALDLVITQEKTYVWLIAHANQFGFHRTVRGEPWHWEYLGGGDQTAVERGVYARPAAAASADDGYGEHPCTRDWGYARPLPIAPDAPESEDAAELPPEPAPEP
jgi:LAS superfamily LD-carboxypeptidase LdcB